MVIRNRCCAIGALCGTAVLVLSFTSSTVLAVPTSVTTAAVGNETQLVSVTFADGRVLGPGTGMIGVDVFQYRNTGGNNTTMVIGNGNAVPANGSRAGLLDTDVALNTGLINPGGSGGITAGTTPTAATVGIGLNFNAPVINGLGVDLILFELSVGAGQAADGFTMSALTGGTGFASVSAGHATFGSGSYTGAVKSAQLAHRTVTQVLPVNDLNDLETKTGTLGATGDAFYNVIAVDLSSMGVAMGGSATGVFIQGADIDPTFVAGLTPSAATGLLQVQTSVTAGVNNLDAVLVNRGSGPEAFLASELVKPNVFHWHAPSNGNTALSVGGVDPGVGNRADALMGDNGLNTGMINPGGTGTLTAAQQATLGPNNNTINGLGVTFDGGLLNGEGIDLIVFEYGDTGARDPFRVNRIDGIVGDLLIASTDYSVFGSNPATRLITPNSSTLNLFESGVFNDTGGVTQGWAGVGIDLSDLGYALGQFAPGLFFSAPSGTGGVDFVFIAGLPAPPVPEPATMSLLALGAAAMLRRQRRGA